MGGIISKKTTATKTKTDDASAPVSTPVAESSSVDLPAEAENSPAQPFENVWEEFKHVTKMNGITRVVLIRHANAEAAKGAKYCCMLPALVFGFVLSLHMYHGVSEINYIAGVIVITNSNFMNTNLLFSKRRP